MPLAGGPIIPLIDSLKLVGGAGIVHMPGEMLAALAAAMGAGPKAPPPDVPGPPPEDPATAIFRLPVPPVVIHPGRVLAQPRQANLGLAAKDVYSTQARQAITPTRTSNWVPRPGATGAAQPPGGLSGQFAMMPRNAVSLGYVTHAAATYSTNNDGTGIGGIVFCEPGGNVQAEGKDPCKPRWKVFDDFMRALNEYRNGTAEGKAAALETLKTLMRLCPDIVNAIVPYLPAESESETAMLKGLKQAPCDWFRSQLTLLFENISSQEYETPHGGYDWVWHAEEIRSLVAFATKFSYCFNADETAWLQMAQEELKSADNPAESPEMREGAKGRTIQCLHNVLTNKSSTQQDD